MVATASLTLTSSEASSLIGLRALLQRVYCYVDSLTPSGDTNEHDDLLDEISRAEESLGGLVIHLS